MLKYLHLLCAVLVANIVCAQNWTVNGYVTSDQGDTLPGVTVFTVGGKTGAITGPDGYYSIEAKSSYDSIKFSFVGYQSVQLPIKGRKTIDVQLQPEVYAVEEVVVTALGITRESKSLGYSATAVDGDELSESSERSMLNALQGKVAGVNISSASGAPGASTRILLRGITSLSGSNQPLFVIDGVPVLNNTSGSTSINGGSDFGNKINDISPEDVASVSILKGASGTALYGSRAANGVIIITTKKGQFNTKSKVNFSSSVGFEKPLRLVEYQNRYGQGLSGNLILYENTSWGPKFDNKIHPWGHTVDNSVRVKPYSALPDNVEEFFETGRNIKNSLSVSGGNESTSYYFSYSNVFWDGIMPTNADSYKKHAISLRSSHKFSKRFDISTSINYIKKQSRFVPTGQGEESVYNQVMQTPRDISLRELDDIDSKWNNVDNYYSLYTVNPYFVLNNNAAEYDENRAFGSLELKGTLTDNLSVLWRSGADVAFENQNEFKEIIDPEGNNEQAFVLELGEIYKLRRERQQLNSDLLLTHNIDIVNFNINTVLGTSLNERKESYVNLRGENLLTENFNNISNLLERPFGNEYIDLKRNVGLFGNISLSFKEFLYFSFSGRNEWSSTLPVENRSYFFPGANVGLILTDLFPNLKGKTVTFGKIRASWAKVGNDTDPYMLNNVFVKASHSDGFGFLGYPILGVNSFENSDLLRNNQLKPEMTTEVELGADLRFLKNRLSLDFSYYDRKSTDLIWNTPIPASSGFKNQVQNLGRISNYGVEALLRIVPVRNSKITWEVLLNYTRNFNKVDYLNSSIENAELNALRVDGGQQISWGAIPGYPVGVYKVRVPKYTANGKMVVDNKGLPIADEELKVVGNSQYKHYGGFTNKIYLGNLMFSFRFDYRIGGTMYSRTKNISQWAGTVPVTLYNDREPFVVPNSVVEIVNEKGETEYVDNTTPINPETLVEYWGNGGELIDEASLLDKSFVILMEIIISYKIPRSLYSKLPISHISLAAIGRNLWLWTPNDQTYIDPESTTFGNDLRADFGEYGAQPTTRSITFSLKASF